MLKSYGWWGGVGWVVAHEILVSAQVPLVLTLGLWTLGLRTHSRILLEQDQINLCIFTQIFPLLSRLCEKKRPRTGEIT